MLVAFLMASLVSAVAVELSWIRTFSDGGSSFADRGPSFGNAWDGNVNTFYDSALTTAYSCFTAVELSGPAVMNSIQFHPRSECDGGACTSLLSRMDGGRFEASNEESNAWTLLYQIPSAPTLAWQNVSITNTSSFRYVRYTGPGTSHCNVAAIRLFGTPLPPPSPSSPPLPPPPPSSPEPPTSLYIRGTTSRLVMGPSDECTLEVVFGSSTISSTCAIAQPSGRRLMLDASPVESILITKDTIIDTMRDELMGMFEGRLAKLEADNVQLKAELKMLRES